MIFSPCYNVSITNLLSQASSLALPVLSTKLYAPPLAPGDLRRERLFTLLHNGWRAGRRLALISAPAGYGKTTLAASWLRSENLPFAWLSLDEGDNDPVRFFTYLLLALRGLDPELGADILPVLVLPQPPPLETLLVTVINAVAAWKQPACLVLDDYHQVRESRIHAMVQFLAGRLPPLLHLAVVTREDPPLALARLRARRQLTEIRTRDTHVSLGMIVVSSLTIARELILPFLKASIALLSASRASTCFLSASTCFISSLRWAICRSICCSLFFSILRGAAR